MTRLSIAVLLTIFIALSGCLKPSEFQTEADFCAVEEPRRFTQEQWEWRKVHDETNLRRDVKTNTAWEREGCDDYAARVAGGS